MEIKHFAHEHPLTLLREEERHFAHDHGYYPINCFGCLGSISRSDPMYACNRCCQSYGYYDFHLHKSCAELPSKAERYMYAPTPPPPPPPPEQHFRASDHGNLTLVHTVGYCILCKNMTGKLMYEYKKKNETVLFCINCARFHSETIEHTSHDHPLHLQRKKSTFTCDACDREETSYSSYHCASCSFWISDYCASLPNTLQHACHDHPLTLIGLFRLGEEYFTKFDIYCDICAKWVKRNNCVYYCAQCLYCSHVGCATTRSIENETSDESNKTEAVQMPASDRSGYLDMVTHLVEQMSLSRSNEGGSRSGQCTSDKHYIVFDAPSDEICDCCVQPISAPYYNCPECRLILHKSCGDLPRQIDHPLHDHPLTLLNPSIFDCSRCEFRCIGFAFHCAICSFYLDIKCSSLPTTIKHEAHKHLLHLQKQLISWCNACHEFMFSDFSDVGYVCTTNCNFSLHMDCALLPRTLTHKYDKHALTLKYKPVGIISKEYYCEICEKDVNPRKWFYYCRDCDYSFHPDCICRNAQIIYQKVKIGAKIISDDLHPCPLTTVIKRRMEGGEVSSADVLLECKKCKFKTSSHLGEKLHARRPQQFSLG